MEEFSKLDQIAGKVIKEVCRLFLKDCERFENNASINRHFIIEGSEEDIGTICYKATEFGKMAEREHSPFKSLSLEYEDIKSEWYGKTVSNLEEEINEFEKKPGVGIIYTKSIDKFFPGKAGRVEHELLGVGLRLLIPKDDYIWVMGTRDKDVLYEPLKKRVETYSLE
jgi:SpoVK/Ycf46/Vps4 family AAA+-type ATPase